MSPAERSLAYLKRRGYWPEMVEKWVSMGKRGGFRRDLWHCVDIEALGEGHVLYVQTTSIGEYAAHVTKIQGLPELDWIKRAAPAVRFELHAWDESVRGGSVKILDLLTLKPVLDSRIMVGHGSKKRKLHQMPLI